ncbi:thrombospondin type 3 repeat-containing protein [Rheinheimera baltica]|uniref:Thrombospondin type 3 repeat-containing protein n=1 Tax=Rheinheimera baltica TaxID=67576 RepID=A0ABT9I302_9GAMM|nr:thrombospondin type 3 repeat-containing protein [Rheinheimera baltica]MDP5137766.1 thrombospondin type 3 repeat-containing protein [Rheinheimera baltica]
MLLKKTAALAVALALSGCGGSGGNTDTITPPPVQLSYLLSGAAVKGPWQNASIQLHELDTSKSDLKGALVASTLSGPDARFTNLRVTNPSADFYLLQAIANSNTTELATSQRPYTETLSTVVSRSQLEANSTIYITPLSSLLTKLVAIPASDSGKTFATKLQDGQGILLAHIGFNLSSADDLLRSSPMLESNTTLNSNFRFRQANEALAVTIFHLIADSDINFDQALAALAEDILDGKIDGNKGIEPIAAFESIADFSDTWSKLAIRHLTIPGTSALGSGSEISLAQLPILLHAEATQLNSNIELSALSALAAQYSIASFGADLDSDGYPDSVDNDIDGDGLSNINDAFPLDANEWLDTDGDGIGNNADADDDNDGYPDNNDAFPLDATEWLDTDGDGIGNNADPDDDNDGFTDAQDAFPLDATEWQDSDGDGIGNNADADDDNDGYPDIEDAFPLDATEWLDTDGDGIGNNADTDDDNDGVTDSDDAFPLDATESTDYDSDGIGDNSDPDRDNDGIPDTEDSELYSLIYRNQVITLDLTFLQSLAQVGMTITEDDNRIIISGGTIHLPPTAENAWYILPKTLQVGLDNGAMTTLRISPGSTLAIQNPKDILLISRGAQLIASGYSQSPITLTSDEDLDSLTASAGQWGGIIMLGQASTNLCGPNTECDLQAPIPYSGSYYSGANQDDNSGQLKYLRVKYAGGHDASSGAAHPALGLFGIGSKTEISYIHIDNVAGDGIAIYGGTANLSQLIVTSAMDDSLDWQHGYTGKLQYVVLRHAQEHTMTNRAIEADNYRLDPSATPVSRPTIANLTIIGNNFNGDDDAEGILLQYGSQVHIVNAIVTGPEAMGECLEIDSSSAVAANDGLTIIRNSVMACENGENFKPISSFDIEQWYFSQPVNSVASGRNAVLNGIYTISDVAPYNFSLDDTFFTPSSHIGAVSEANNWTADWSLLEQ